MFVSLRVCDAQIRVREHSFLDNPRTPREVKESRVIVDFDGIRHQDDRDSQRVMLQSGLSDYVRCFRQPLCARNQQEREESSQSARRMREAS